jgi:hypothetical protein
MSRKSRWRSAANDEGRSVAGARLVSSAGENLVALGTLSMTAETEIENALDERLSESRVPKHFRGVHRMFISRYGVAVRHSGVRGN